MSKGKIFFASILAVLAWWCANKVTWQVRTDQEAGRDFSQIIDRFTLDLPPTRYTSRLRGLTC